MSPNDVVAASDALRSPGGAVLVGNAQALSALLAQWKVWGLDPQGIRALVCCGAVCDLEVHTETQIFASLDDFLHRKTVFVGCQVLVCLPLALSEELARIQNALAQAGLDSGFLPSLPDQLAGRVRWDTVAVNRAQATVGSRRLCTDESVCRPQGALDRPAIPVQPLRSPLWAIDPEKLLDRRPHPLDETSIHQLLSGKVVLITGAGGSIGSELARTVCRFGPQRLVLVERAENALFEIDRDLARSFPEIERSLVLHDVTDAPRTLSLVGTHKPQVIFHAAAHKHVPMMEEHPSAAVENNFYGTRSIADAACRMGVGRFVMISSDKAVRPSSVMGATKRLAELYTQYLSGRSETVFSMVRFGNVLGSACSVLPIWSDQLARGGPITVTHPQMTRYFMTIPEAAGLVIQSAVYSGLAGGGEVFLLDMGQPIRIVDLAHRFLRSQGLEPGRDIAIEFTGIRPGEKLFEELAYESEEMIPTPHPSVRMWKTTRPDAMQMRHIMAAFDRLRGCADGKGRHYWQDVDREQLLDAIRSAVPEMVPSVRDAGSQPMRSMPLRPAV